MSNQEQNIFTAKKRSANEVIKAPFMFKGDSEQQYEKTIMQQTQKSNESFQKYMERHYVVFNHKINKCKLGCIQRNNSYSQIKNCYSNCEVGVQTFRRFVDQRIKQMQSLLNQCTSNAASLPNSLNETYRCYELYNKGFSHLRSIIKQESLYYQ